MQWYFPYGQCSMVILNYKYERNFFQVANGMTLQVNNGNIIVCFVSVERQSQNFSQATLYITIVPPQLVCIS